MLNRLSAATLAVAGAILLGLDILIIIWPTALVWLVAALIILAGIAMLVIANGLRSFQVGTELQANSREQELWGART